MTTKVAVVSTIAIILGAVVIGLGILFLSGGRNAELLGQGLGMLVLLPLFAIWILWADRFRKERERRNNRS